MREVECNGEVGFSQPAGAVASNDPDEDNSLKKVLTPNMWSWDYVGLCKKSIFLSILLFPLDKYRQIVNTRQSDFCTELLGP